MFITAVCVLFLIKLRWPKNKSIYDKGVDLSLCALAPPQSQMDSFFDKLCAQNKQRAANFNRSEEDMSRVTASAMFFQGQDNLFLREGVL